MHSLLAGHAHFCGDPLEWCGQVFQRPARSFKAHRLDGLGRRASQLLRISTGLQLAGDDRRTATDATASSPVQRSRVPWSRSVRTGGRCAENIKQQFAGRCCSVHAFGERTKGNLPVFQRVHYGKQVLAVSARVDRASRRQARRQVAGIQTPGPSQIDHTWRRMRDLLQVTDIDTRRLQRITLQVGISGDPTRAKPHVAYKHVRKTHKVGLPCATP